MPRASGDRKKARVALVSMPWVSAWVPSIQLAVLRQCLSGRAECDSYELYLDYAALISNQLYRNLSEAGGIIEEWVFAKDFFEQEGIEMPDGFLDEFPSFGLPSRETERRLVTTLPDITNDYLQRLSASIDWGRYDIVAFSLSIYQTTASLALSRRIKLLHPTVKIVFGGNSCVGPAGPALMKISSYVDVVVRSEAEPVFAPLVEALADGADLAGLGSIVYRDGSDILTTESAGLHPMQPKPTMPEFDSFFERFERLEITQRERIWLPFESSRGCWWGQKSQCTFCGLHEIMKYRARPADDVIAELDYLNGRYGVSRFFATDLIMPNEYYRDLLPELIRSGRDYQFFYELKANVSWGKVALLAHAGVKDVQPGLESLSSSVLRTMKKGQTAAHVVQFLKWATEFGLDVQWNIIVGTPTEDPNENTVAARRAAALFHFKPPRLIHFELDRYSPIFNDPESFGLSNVKPLYIYNYIFPIADDLIADLVYRFEYDEAAWEGHPPWLGGDGEGFDHPREYHEVIRQWEAAAEREAFLTVTQVDDELVIKDTRFSDEMELTVLPPHEGLLYKYLDRLRRRATVAGHFGSRYPDAARAFGGLAKIDQTIYRWLDRRLVFEEDGRVVGVAVWTPERRIPQRLLRDRKANRPIRTQVLQHMQTIERIGTLS